MKTLSEYVRNHTARGACQCGQCIDGVSNPQEHQPTGHTSDLFFFKVAKHGEPDAKTLRELITKHHGEWGECNPLDGKEHNYMELGGWIGDQGLAMQFMGLGELLGLWRVMTPNALPIPDELKQQMAGMGMISILPHP